MDQILGLNKSDIAWRTTKILQSSFKFGGAGKIGCLKVAESGRRIFGNRSYNIWRVWQTHRSTCRQFLYFLHWSNKSITCKWKGQSPWTLFITGSPKNSNTMGTPWLVKIYWFCMFTVITNFLFIRIKSVVLQSCPMMFGRLFLIASQIMVIERNVDSFPCLSRHKCRNN